MPDQANTAGQHAVATDLGASGNTCTTGYGSVFANLHVVGDHDLVIQFHAIADDCVGQRTAVDRGIGADLYIITNTNAAELSDLLPVSAFIGEPEAFAANDRTWLDHYALTDAHVMTKGDARSDPATRTHPRTGSNARKGADHDVRAYPGARLDHHLSANTGAWVDRRSRINDSTWVDTRQRLGARLEQVRDARIGEIGIVHDQRGAGETFGILRLEQYGASTGAGEILA